MKQADRIAHLSEQLAASLLETALLKARLRKASRRVAELEEAMGRSADERGKASDDD